MCVCPFLFNRSLLTVELIEVIHTIQASYFRMWFLLPTAVLCGFLELIGWSARLWSSQSPFLQKPFTIQWVQSPFGPSVCSQMPRVTTLVVAPTLLVAANFILLGRVIRRLGPQYSRLTPKLCESHIQFSLIRIGLNVDIDAIVFLFCVSIFCPCQTRVLLTVLKDVVSLVVQGIGGTTVSVAKTLKEANLVRMHSRCSADPSTHPMHGISGLAHHSRWCSIPAWCVRHVHSYLDDYLHPTSHHHHVLCPSNGIPHSIRTGTANTTCSRR
jgi:RTA1 like protein